MVVSGGDGVSFEEILKFWGRKFSKKGGKKSADAFSIYSAGIFIFF
jgi:hypothetical protein